MAVGTSRAPLTVWDLRQTPVPIVASGLAFLLLFWTPIITLGRDWWHDPEAGHGLLLGPLALVLAWRGGRAPHARAQPWLGVALLAGAVLLRYVSGLAAELFTMRMSLMFALFALVAYVWGFGQLRRQRHQNLPGADNHQQFQR